MILHGRNLIIKQNGFVIAGSKSCHIKVGCDLQEVSSPTTGQWKEFMAMRKSWSVTTSHLLMEMDNLKWSKLEAFSASWVDYSRGVRGYVTLDGIPTSIQNNRGLYLFKYTYNSTTQKLVLATQTLYDTYNASTASLVSALSGGGYAVAALVSQDAYKIDGNLRSAISTYMKIPTDSIPLISNARNAFVAIGGPSVNGMAAIAEDGRVGSSHVSLNMSADVANYSTMLKTAKNRVGQRYTIRVQVDGFPDDTMYGSAICKTWEAQGTLSNLMTGSFEFQGSGPLT